MGINLYKILQRSMALGWCIAVGILCYQYGFDIIAIFKSVPVLIVLLLMLRPFKKYISDI